MQQRILVIGALVALVGIAGFVVFTGEQDPTGRAIGAGANEAGAELWQSLAKYERNHLRTWRGAFDNQEPEAIEVLEAWSELAYSITGPGGFWRKTVPHSWLGCAALGNSPACKALDGSKGEFGKWDKFQEKVGNVSEGKAARFLGKNQAKMLDYIKRYVPDAPSASGMEATGFYTDKLEATLGDPSAALGGDDDL